MTQTELTPTTSLTGKWKPYPAYKDSGVEWLEEIPAHWEMIRLKYAAPSSTTKLTEKPDDLPFLGLENIESQTGRLLVDTPIENVDSTVGVFNRGNVLFGKLRPYLAKAVCVDFSGVCTTELLVLQPSTIVNGKFLFYRLLSEDFIKLVNSLTYGTKCHV
jgi:type I restriction enzyme, S subunit